MNGRIRVLHLIGDSGPYPYPYFQLIGENANRHRFDVGFASVGPGGALQQDACERGLHAFSLDATCRQELPGAAARLLRRLRRYGVDVVHAHSLDASVVGLVAARAARRPVGVITAHSSHETPLHDKPALTAVDTFCLGRLAHRVIAPSSQMRETLTGPLGVAPGKVTVIEHGFRLDHFDPAQADGTTVRLELGLGDRLVLGAVGRLFWIKNQEALVHAFAPIAADEPDAVLLIVGVGDRAPVQAAVRRLGLERRVVIAPARTDVPAVLAAIDVLVHPALAESFGLVIVEAMAMGTPLVSTPVGIAAELLSDQRAGVLAGGGSSDELETAIRAALGRRDEWPKMGAEGRRLAARFTPKRMLARYEALYEQLLTAGRPNQISTSRHPSRWSR